MHSMEKVLAQRKLGMEEVRLCRTNLTIVDAFAVSPEFVSLVQVAARYGTWRGEQILWIIHR
jgi:hypothetical protein